MDTKKHQPELMLFVGGGCNKRYTVCAETDRLQLHHLFCDVNCKRFEQIDFCAQRTDPLAGSTAISISFGNNCPFSKNVVELRLKYEKFTFS